MIFKIVGQKDSWLEKAYQKAMDDLGKFFGINWTEDRPKVFVLPDRKTINQFMGKETPGWLVGFGGKGMGGVYLLDRTNFEKESENIYSDERYEAYLKHELCHCFIDIVTKGYRKPIWIIEGLTTYLSGQLKWKKSVKLTSFLNFFEGHTKEVYQESGFAVEILLKKYGKEKMLELLKRLSTKPDKEQFKNIFKEVYGVKLNIDLFQ